MNFIKSRTAFKVRMLPDGTRQIWRETPRWCPAVLHRLWLRRRSRAGVQFVDDRGWERDRDKGWFPSKTITKLEVGGGIVCFQSAWHCVMNLKSLVTESVMMRAMLQFWCDVFGPAPDILTVLGVDSHQKPSPTRVESKCEWPTWAGPDFPMEVIVIKPVGCE